MSVTRGQTVTQADMNTLAALAHTKLGGTYTFGASGWIATLNKIRLDLFNSTRLYNASPTRTPTSSWYCSGPWVVAQGLRCGLYLPVLTGANFPAYQNLKFLWPTTASAGPGFQEEGYLNQAFSAGLGNPGNETYSTDRTGLLNGTIVYKYTAATDGFNRLITQANYALAGGGTGLPFTFNGYIDAGLGTQNGVFTFTFTALSSSASYNFKITAPATTGALTITATPALLFSNNSKTYPGVSAGIGIHPTSAISQCSLANTTSADVNLVVNGNNYLFQTHWLSDTPGVYTANTLPTWAVHTFLDQDLPQYYDPTNIVTEPTTGTWAHGTTYPHEATATNGKINSVTVSGGTGRSSLWPVFPVSSFTFSTNFPNPYFVYNTDPLNQYVFDPFHILTETPYSLAAGEHTPPELSLTSTLLHNIKIWTTDPTQTILVKLNDIADPLNYDYSATGSFDLVTATSGVIAPWVNALWSWCIVNPNGTPSSGQVQVMVQNTDSNSVYSDTPIFFAASTFTQTQIEPFSYAMSPHLVDSTTNSMLDCYLNVPPSGYCIYDVVVRRTPVDNGNGIFLAPSAGQPALEIDIGVMVGASWSTPGTFTLLQTVTIAANAAEYRFQPFWPVIGGAPLAWQPHAGYSGTVQIYAGVNFQPAVFSNYWPYVVTGQPSPGNHEFDAYFRTDLGWQLTYRSILSNPAQTTGALLPIASDFYNDLTTVLGLL